MDHLPGSLRKKRRVVEKPGSLLPICTDSSLLKYACKDGMAQVYSAYYENGTIIVRKSKEAEALWHNGYFGERRGQFEVNTNNRKKHRKLVCVDDLVKGQPLFDYEEGSEKDEENDKHSEMNYEMDKSLERVELIDSSDKNEEFSTPQDNSEECSIDKSESNQEKNSEGYRNEEIQYNVHLSDGGKGCEWRTVLEIGSRKADPHPSSIYSKARLTLLPVEAFFLSCFLRCLDVFEVPSHNNTGQKDATTKGRKLDEEELWTGLTKDDPEFAVKYLVYHHYRTKGWIVKCGLKYGADWVLYPVGPPFYHAQYTVTIHCIWADTLTLVHNEPECQLDWATLAATERVSTHVNKIPIYCFVLRPRDMTEGKLRHYNCLKELKLQEMIVSRWNPDSSS